MKMQSIQDLMITGLTYTLDFEKQLAEAAPKMAEATTNSDLKDMFEKTQTKSNEYATKIEGVFGKFGQKVERNTNYIAQSMIKEVEEMIKNTDAGPVRDAALIVAVNQQQSYRVSNYGSLRSYAELLGKQDAVSALQENLDDSKQGNDKFTAIAEKTINPAAKAA